MADKANQRQVGGQHYKHGDHEEHWDRAWRLKYDPFQYIITKWIERWRDKGGVEDLKKAQHAIQKYIELVEAGKAPEFNPPVEDAKLFGPGTLLRDAIKMEGPFTQEQIDRGAAVLASLKEPPTRGPDAFKAAVAAVKQTGYVGFTYEGGSAEWDLFTCRKCRAEVRVGVNENPAGYHICSGTDITGGVAG